MECSEEQEVHQVAQTGEADMKLRRMKLTKYERQLEQELLRGEWGPGKQGGV